MANFSSNFQISTFHVTMSCDAAAEEAEETFQICKELKESQDEEIMKFVKYVKHHRVIFTAANCFEINRRTIPSIINVLTNYLIVILQFNGISIHQT